MVDYFPVRSAEDWKNSRNYLRENMAYETILLEHHNSVLLIKLNRPESLNAINKKMLTELCAVLQSADKDNNVRVAVIIGSDKFFAA